MKCVCMRHDASGQSNDPHVLMSCSMHAAVVRSRPSERAVNTLPLLLLPLSSPSLSICLLSQICFSQLSKSIHSHEMRHDASGPSNNPHVLMSCSIHAAAVRSRPSERAVNTRPLLLLPLSPPPLSPYLSALAALSKQRPAACDFPIHVSACDTNRFCLLDISCTIICTGAQVQFEILSLLDLSFCSAYVLPHYWYYRR